VTNELMHNDRQFQAALLEPSGAFNMKKMAVPHLRQQEKVNAYFQSQSSYWKDIYASTGVQGEIYRERHTAVLAWIDSLALVPGSKVLEIGCGAGFMAVALAERGFHVYAIDSTEEMVKLARRHAAESGNAAQISLDVGEVYALNFEDGFFALVIALGVIPWLERVERAIQEMARVIKPGGYVILTADNRARLIYLLDPWLNPALQPLRKGVKAVLKRVGFSHWFSDEINSTLHDWRFIDDILARAGLVKTRSRTIGFGPFSLLHRNVLPEPLSRTLHRRLQRLANRNVPIFRSTGTQYLVLARKSVPRPLAQSTSAEKLVSNITSAP
jgi:ubiquinone/menaquinone biosynthesis C-methylase UbiE